MNRFASHIAQSKLAQLSHDEEHVVLLALPGEVELRRRDDLLDEGVAAVFGLAGGEAELLGLCFRAKKFTPAEAAKWLAERRFVPLVFVPNSGRLVAAYPKGEECHSPGGVG